MSRKRIFFVALFLISFGVVYYLYGGSSTPKGQPPLTRFCFRRSYAAEECVQQLSIFYSRGANAFTDLSVLLAGGLCHRTVAAGNQ